MVQQLRCKASSAAASPRVIGHSHDRVLELRLQLGGVFDQLGHQGARDGDERLEHLQHNKWSRACTDRVAETRESMRR